MAPSAALHLTASQKETAGSENDTTTMAVADLLLRTLQAPVKLEWETDLDDHSTGAKATVRVSVDLSTESPTWPPRKFNLRVIPSDTTNKGELNLLSVSGFEVSSSIAASRLAELLHAGSTSLSPELLGTAESAEDTINESSLSVPGEKPTSLLSQLSTLPLVDSDVRSGVVQPACLYQWHGNTCGHHALYSIQCLLHGQAGMLQSYHGFWQSTLHNMRVLADHGETSGCWPPSRVNKGVVDEVHLRHLIESSETLRGRVSIAQTAEAFNKQLECPSSALRAAIDDVLCGRSQAHGFLLGATNHWYAAVAVAGTRDASAPGELGATRLFFCDSYNRPLVHLQNAQDVEETAEKCVQKWREDFLAKLRCQPEWEHRPQDHLDLAFEEGLTEWWKGNKKASLFWREQPLEVKSQLKKQELENVRSYLTGLSSVLGLSAPEQSGQ